MGVECGANLKMKKRNSMAGYIVEIEPPYKASSAGKQFTFLEFGLLLVLLYFITETSLSIASQARTSKEEQEYYQKLIENITAVVFVGFCFAKFAEFISDYISANTCHTWSNVTLQVLPFIIFTAWIGSKLSILPQAFEERLSFAMYFL